MEAAGVEPASENTSPSDPTCVFPFEVSQPDENGTKSPGRPFRTISSRRSGRPAATSLLNDGRPPRRRQPQGDRSLVIKQRERSQYSQLANVHRIYEVMALGTRPTFQYPRRSQVAPKRQSRNGKLRSIVASAQNFREFELAPTRPTRPTPPPPPPHSTRYPCRTHSAHECARSRFLAALRSSGCTCRSQKRGSNQRSIG